VSAAKILLLVFSILVLVGALALVFGGAALTWAYQSPTDDGGFVSTGDIHIERESRAVTTRPIDIDEDALKVLDWIGLDVFRVVGSSENPDKQIFMGISSEWDALDYLKDVDYDEITRVRHRLSLARVEYENHPGAREPAVPASEGFWEVQMVSTPDQKTHVLEWEPEGGSHVLVLMNADGSAGLDLTVSLEVQLPAVVLGLGIGLLAGAMGAFAVGGVMVHFAVRQP
jgi:hypothetical protein